MTITDADRIVYEGTTASYSATVTDENGDAVGSGSLTTLTLTLYDDRTGQIINGRNAQNVLNTNGVTVSAAGALVWTIAKDDNVILHGSDYSSYEDHYAIFHWTWDSGSKSGRHVVKLRVKNLKNVS